MCGDSGMVSTLCSCDNGAKLVGLQKLTQARTASIHPNISAKLLKALHPLKPGDEQLDVKLVTAARLR